MANLNFNATNHEPTDPNKTGYEPLKPGWYIMEISESEIRDTNAGDGKYLNLTFEGLDEHCKGQKTWGRINTQNPSEQCMRIGKRQLGDLCHAVGVLDLTDTAQLHRKPLGVKVKITEWNDKKRNEPVAFCKVDNIPTLQKPAPTEKQEALTHSGGSVFD